MMSRFFKLLTYSLLLASVAQAQVTPPATTPDPKKKPKEGFFRFWNLLPRSESELTLVKNDGTPEGDPLLSAAPGNYYATYINVPVGKYALKVVRRSDPKSALEAFDTTVRPGDYVTFLARLVEGKPKLEIVDDTFDPVAATAGRLTIRQHFPDASVVVTTNTQLSSRPLATGETQAIEGLPLKLIELKMKATLPNGQTQTWTSEVDFRAARHASLLVVPDPYGRFRPRVSIDGNPNPPTPVTQTPAR